MEKINEDDADSSKQSSKEDDPINGILDSSMVKESKNNTTSKKMDFKERKLNIPPTSPLLDL